MIIHIKRTCIHIRVYFSCEPTANFNLHTLELGPTSTWIHANEQGREGQVFLWINKWARFDNHNHLIKTPKFKSAQALIKPLQTLGLNQTLTIIKSCLCMAYLLIHDKPYQALPAPLINMHPGGMVVLQPNITHTYYITTIMVTKPYPIY